MEAETRGKQREVEFGCIGERERKRERTTLAVGSGWIDEGLSRRKGGWGLAGWDDERRLVGRQAMVEVPERDARGWVALVQVGDGGCGKMVQVEDGGCGRLCRRRVASAIWENLGWEDAVDEGGWGCDGEGLGRGGQGRRGGWLGCPRGSPPH
ncbi:unnamed protein product [Prunus armeniaca]|uniref:Uncharacterized protein n=1 Tax=Prunus armeniaca TaxID=36596 RepID=A0A6J5WVQ4_PRUAR|nr:unnamed protein product [Prunus armeniaca]